MNANGEGTGGSTTNLSPADAALFETNVAPRYLSIFAEPLLAMLVGGGDARVCHLGCRTGYPDVEVQKRLEGAHVYGCDTSSHAIELAKAKAKANPGMVGDYRVVDRMPLPFPRAAFSHAFAIHPAHDRGRVFEELARIVAARGQALVALPLFGSFAEIDDLLRECALKLEITPLLGAVDNAAQLRPTEAMLMTELTAAGFDYVEVTRKEHKIPFASGRDFFDDPITRLVILPELRLRLAMSGPNAVPIAASVGPFAYVREAIDKYWSDGRFELTVNVGVVGGRRQ